MYKQRANRRSTVSNSWQIHLKETYIYKVLFHITKQKASV